ncbi:butyrate kinase [Halosquirtibacter laminarini]|uniref:Butyrate kinase n=1 Tax=Halosquirtibacter laminarini TaxID=3374600 RepID=A0AC61NIW6_9BACT|nr:butyrate kinase [Prolixibacteraceae bacterium]
MKETKVLAINPGSTSTKIAVYQNKKCVFLKTIRHSAEELAQYETIYDQFAFRKKMILKELGAENIGPGAVNVIVARGGLTKPLESGVYEVNQAMIDDINSRQYGMHASNLAPLLAYDLASKIPNTQAFISDPVVTDELAALARTAGHPLFERKSIFHALNQKAVARAYANSISKPYDSLNLIVAHLGGGVSVGIHEKGNIIDVNNALDGEGPLSPERSGSLPNGQLVDLCFSGDYTQSAIRKMICGRGGFVAHLGTSDGLEIQSRAEAGDDKAQHMIDVMAYQISKAIGEMATVVAGKVDAILITGGLAYDKAMVAEISRRVSFLAPISIHPGEDEMDAMYSNAQRYLDGEEALKVYE